MEFEEKKQCCEIKVDGFIEKGKQFDLEITLPEDNRDVIYGIIKDCYKEPIENAVVKLIEVCYEYGKEERNPVSHTFTDKDGEFVFGPLCPDKKYEIQVWVDRVKHCKQCVEAKRHGKCLKGVKLECKDYRPDYKKDYKSDDEADYKPDYKKEHKDDYKEEHKEDYKEDCKPEDKDDKKDCKQCCR